MPPPTPVSIHVSILAVLALCVAGASAQPPADDPTAEVDYARLDAGLQERLIGPLEARVSADLARRNVATLRGVLASPQPPARRAPQPAPQGDSSLAAPSPSR